MANLYDHLSPDDVKTLDALARLLLELRESHRALLTRYGVEEEGELFEKICTGAVAEHPAYEDYLGAKTIAAARDAIRTDLKEYMLAVRLP